MAKRLRRKQSRRIVRKRTEYDFAHRLRTARIALGLTQEDVAGRAKLTPKFLSEVENDHSSPTMGVAVRLIVDGLGVSLAEFFAHDTASRDEVAKIRALLAGKPVAVRRQALALVRALVKS